MLNTDAISYALTEKLQVGSDYFAVLSDGPIVTCSLLI